MYIEETTILDLFKEEETTILDLFKEEERVRLPIKAKRGRPIKKKKIS